MDIKTTRDGSHYKGSARYEPGVDPALLPCPFCGGMEIEVHHTHTPSYTVTCEGCEAECSTPSSLGLRDRLKSEVATRDTHRRGFLAAIEAWNRRVPVAVEPVRRVDDSGWMRSLEAQLESTAPGRLVRCAREYADLPQVDRDAVAALFVGKTYSADEALVWCDEVERRIVDSAPCPRCSRRHNVKVALRSGNKTLLGEDFFYCFCGTALRKQESDFAAQRPTWHWEVVLATELAPL